MKFLRRLFRRQPQTEPVSDFRDHPRMIAKRAVRLANRAPDQAAIFERKHIILDQKLGKPYLPTPWGH